MKVARKKVARKKKTTLDALVTQCLENRADFIDEKYKKYLEIYGENDMSKEDFIKYMHSMVKIKFANLYK